MEFFGSTTNIDFMKIRKWAGLFSLLLITVSLVSLVTRGINWGLDFTGGIVIELSYPENADISKIRSVLFANDYRDAVVQNFGSSRDIIIRLAPRKISEQIVANQILQLMQNDTPAVKLRRVDAVGAQVGKELTQRGILAVIVALIATMIYIGLRFEYRFAISSAVAMAHDPIVIMGVFSVFQLEFDLTALAAILAVIGYSLNDTIVVFDRVRENFIKIRKASAVEIMNLSINQTLSRTIMTSGMTSLVVIALLIFGGPSLFGFSLALIVGIVVGTYSSIYIAGALSVKLGLNKKDLMPVARRDDGIQL